MDKRTGRFLATDNEQIGGRVFHGQWSSPSLGWVGNRPLVFFGAATECATRLMPPPDRRQSRVAAQSLVLRLHGPLSPGPLRQGHRLLERRPPRASRQPERRPIPFSLRDHRHAAFYKNRVYVAIGEDPQHGRGRGLLTCIDATKTGILPLAARSGRTTASTAACRRSRSPTAWSTRPTCLAASIAWMPRRENATGSMTASPISGLPRWWWTARSSWGPARPCTCWRRAGIPRFLPRSTWGRAIRSMPVAADGTLYVASQRYLWAVEDLKRNHRRHWRQRLRRRALYARHDDSARDIPPAP